MNGTYLKPLRSFNQPEKIMDLDKDFQSWKSQFDSLFIDVGCGVGYHPLQLAQLYSRVGVLAIERTQTKFQSMQRRIKNHNLKNIYALHCDARNWLINNIEDSTVEQFFFLYPNPYPKEKQANKRWHRDPFFEIILQKLTPQGLITFATNEEWLNSECENYILNFWNLRLVSKELFLPNTVNTFRTHFEKKYLLRGDTCFNLVFTKK